MRILIELDDLIRKIWETLEPVEIPCYPVMTLKDKKEYPYLSNQVDNLVRLTREKLLLAFCSKFGLRKPYVSLSVEKVEKYIGCHWDEINRETLKNYMTSRRVKVSKVSFDFW
jgi:hypothetical protein